jgi:hypothetical protein
MPFGRAEAPGGLRMCGAQWQSLFLNSDAASIRVNCAIAAERQSSAF